MRQSAKYAAIAYSRFSDMSILRSKIMHLVLVMFGLWKLTLYANTFYRDSTESHRVCQNAVALFPWI